MPQPPAYNSGPVPYNSGPPAYPTAMPAQTAYPSYPQQNAPSSQPAQSPYPNYPHQSSQQPYPAYPQQSPPAYPQQQPYPNASAPAPGSAPPAYPSYSPMPSYSPLPGGTPYGAVLPYGAGYPAQMQRAPLSQCRVCGSMIATGVLSCPICLVPLGMILRRRGPGCADRDPLSSSVAPPVLEMIPVSTSPVCAEASLPTHKALFEAE